jgi:hypothetical protein
MKIKSASHAQFIEIPGLDISEFIQSGKILEFLAAKNEVLMEGIANPVEADGSQAITFKFYRQANLDKNKIKIEAETIIVRESAFKCDRPVRIWQPTLNKLSIFTRKTTNDLRAIASHVGIANNGTREELIEALSEIKIAGRPSPTKYRGISID